MTPSTQPHDGKQAVRAWLQQRRGAQLPPPAPAALRHLFGHDAPPAAPDDCGDDALAAAGLALARSGGLSAITIDRLAGRLRIGHTASLQARGAAALQLLAAACHEREYFAQVVWRAHEAPPGLARLHRMFEGAADRIATDGAYSPFADPPAATFQRLSGEVVAALELGRSRWRSALLGELRAAQASGELLAHADYPALLEKLAALLHDMRRDRHQASAEALAERACAGMEGLLARHRAAPATVTAPVTANANGNAAMTPAAAASTSAWASASTPLSRIVRQARPPRAPLSFHWPDWLMAGAPYGEVAP